MVQKYLRTAAAMVAAGAVGLAGCKTNPATGEKFFSPVAAAQINAMGAEAAPQLAAEFGGPVNNAQLQAYVTRVGQSLASQTEADFPKLDWQFTLLDSSVVNAFALPGGKVFITRGLVQQMSNEAQLAGVLGHEVGHVTAEHIARRIGQQQLVSIGLQATGVAVSAAGETVAAAGQVLMPALDVGGQVLLLKFGRDEESQADYLGMRYMSRAGYDPRAQLTVMEILKADSEAGRPPEFLSSHPLPETRIERIEKLLRDDFGNAGGQLYEERFQREFLSALRTLPPPRQPGSASAPASSGQLRATPDQVIGRPGR